MTDTLVTQIAREALVMILLLSLPTLAVSLLVGLVISILQAVTQVQEQSLTFVPKIVAVFLALAITAPWLVRLMTSYTTRLFQHLPNLTG
ncbi:MULTISPECIES: flagellar biosynthesis protein FliQ [Desulfofundulus]|uniref:Flagellar biosynthetic protein FliQ n=1 Tax=Desulfofundulus australicus DSM 11792 TaxID=1121425 RepID=A0A1M4VK28_9FIRM|nr:MULTISPECIES: flagellar biosynthesis protein FliQ [Desulfofundulus]MBE3585651.1 flagellar biosynthesis protein FliQ [Thermoanaerobacter sp.]MCS5696683.1 flagellar biosynthesis protein FliQ [Desulfofundulus thermocisternus]SHE69220.1 flagellar biosynthetic protein FliQ [Desulfofundulus australicus DSM 11792]